MSGLKIHDKVLNENNIVHEGRRKKTRNVTLDYFWRYAWHLVIYSMGKNKNVLLAKISNVRVPLETG